MEKVDYMRIRQTLLDQRSLANSSGAKQEKRKQAVCKVFAEPVKKNAAFP
jgi:hypothetical protein